MKIAVVGSGVSGLAAMWLLHEHSHHEPHLFAADSQAQDDYSESDIDLFDSIVFNPSTSPNFLSFLNFHSDHKLLPIKTTLGVSRDNGVFEWASKSLRTVFCQPSRILDPGMWRLLYDITRFNTCAKRFIIKGTKPGRRASSPVPGDDCSIGEYLRREEYSKSFRDNYLIPLISAIWSTPSQRCSLEFSARTIIQFLYDNRLLQMTGTPVWLTLQGGRKYYTNQILSVIPESQIHLSRPVHSIITNHPYLNARPFVTFKDEEKENYGHIIMACDSDTALSLLKAGGARRDGVRGGINDQEEDILSSFGWSSSKAVLHLDTRFMPKSCSAWSSWNYLVRSKNDGNVHGKAICDQVSLTYDLNQLQHRPEQKSGPVLMTLNPLSEPEEEKVYARFNYRHPILNVQAVRAQESLPRIQCSRAISYAGAYFNYGLHEDAFTSGLRAASEFLYRDKSLSFKLPFEIKSAERKVEKVGLAAMVFDWFEHTGARQALGVWGTWLLMWTAFWLGFVIDIEPSEKRAPELEED